MLEHKYLAVLHLSVCSYEIFLYFFFEDKFFLVSSTMNVYSLGRDSVGHSPHCLLASNCACTSHRHKKSVMPKYSFHFFPLQLLAFLSSHHLLYFLSSSFLLPPLQLCYFLHFSLSSYTFPLSRWLFSSQFTMIRCPFSALHSSMSATCPMQSKKANIYVRFLSPSRVRILSASPQSPTL